MSALPTVTEPVEPTPGGALGGGPLTPRTARRLALFGMLVAVLFGVLLLRLWFLQVVGARDFSDQATANTVRTINIPAPRGLIVDRTGRPLAESKLAWDLVALPQDMSNATGDGLSDRGRATLRRLARALGVPASRLQKRMVDGITSKRVERHRSVVLAADIEDSSDLFLALNERIDEFPGIRLERSSRRAYGEAGPVLSHVLGSVGDIPAEEAEALAKRGYRADAVVGLAGLEKRYEEFLRGRDGVRRVEVDASGKSTPRGVLSETPPKSGATLQTSIDLDVQMELASQLRERVLLESSTLDSGGGGVVLDITTGEVIALASFPQLDPALISRGKAGNRFVNRTRQPGKRLPYFNRAIQAYPPASTFKTITTIAALEADVLERDEVIRSPKQVTLHQTPFRNFRGQDQGFIPLTEAIRVSSDTYFYQVADRIFLKADPAGQAAGHNALYDWAKALGFGQATNIDMIPGEARGVLPDRLWKATNIKPGSESQWNRWRPGDTINMGVGQGLMTATPLQMARAYAALLHPEHKLLTPTIGRRIVDPVSQQTISDPTRGRAESVLPPIDPQNIETIKLGMLGVTTSGSGTTGRVFSRMGGLIAGKTGTAERQGLPDHSWFVGYGPASPGTQPKYVVAVLVENAGLGGKVAAPIACRTLAVALDRSASDCSGGVTVTGGD